MVYVENPEKFADKYKLKSSRFKNWDYSNSGFYFVTIKTLNNNNFFGKINNGKIELSKIGEIVKYEWLQTSKIRKNIKLDEWIIMPDHFHGIINILCCYRDVMDVCCRDVARYVSTGEKKFFSNISPKANSLSTIIRSFKSAVTNKCNQNHFNFGWQSRFHDQITQSEKELNNIRQYVKNNIKNWKNNHPL